MPDKLDVNMAKADYKRAKTLYDAARQELDTLLTRYNWYDTGSFEAYLAEEAKLRRQLNFETRVTMYVVAQEQVLRLLARHKRYASNKKPANAGNY